MNKTLDKILKRNIIGNIKNFLAIIVIVFLSVTLLSGFLVNSATLENAVNKYYSTTNLADMWLKVDKVSEADEQFFVQNEIEYEKRLSFDVKLTIKNSSIENKSKIFVYNEKKEISTPYIINELEGIRAEGCWIDQNFAKENNLIIGQSKLSFSFQLKSSDNEIIDIPLDLLLTGTMCLCEQSVSSLDTAVLIDKNVFINKVNKYLSLENKGVMQDIIFEKNNDLPYNELLIKNANLSQNERNIREYFEKSDTKLLSLLKQDSIESIVLINSELSQSKQMIFIFPIIFLIVAVLVMITSISQLILQEKYKIGILKSLGANNKTLLGHYSKYGIVLTLIGICAGLLIGPIVITDLMFLKYDMIYSIPKDFVSLTYPFYLIAAISIFIVIAGGITAYVISKKVVNKTAIECLKNEIKIKLKSKNKKSKLTLPLRVSLRNLKLNPVRTIMAIFGIAGCLALMLCSFGIRDTLNNSINNDENRFLKYDISTKYISDDFINKLSSIEGVIDFEEYKVNYAEIKVNENTKNLSIYEIKENSKFLNMGLASGEVAVSKSIAENFGLKINDEFEISANRKLFKVKVDKIVETATNNSIYACIDFDFDENHVSKHVWIDVEGILSNIITEINEINGTNAAKTSQEEKNEIINRFSSISLITTTLIIFALALAIIVLLNFVNLITKERAKQIATLKVVGQSDYTISLSMLVEIFIIGITGILLGLSLGYPLLLLVLGVNKVASFNFINHISLLSFIFSILIALIIFGLSAVYCWYKVKRTPVVESLKNFE